MPKWRSNLSPMILHALCRPSKFTVIRAVVSSWFHALNCCFFFLLKTGLKKKTLVSSEPVLFYTTSELFKSMMFKRSLSPLLCSLSLLIQLLRWNISFTHIVCCYMYVNFLEQEKVFAREKSSTLPGIFWWTKQKHGCQGFTVLVHVVRSS